LSVPLVLVCVFRSAASAAHAPRPDVAKHSKKEGDKEENSNAKRVVTQETSKSGNAVLSWWPAINRFEVIEDAWIANSVAVQRLLYVLSKGC
jgi:hypothetical protein